MQLGSQTVTPAQALEIARDHLRAGRIAEAESVCRNVLENEPRNPEALLFLGVAAYQRGEYTLAVELIEQAVGLALGRPEFLANLGAGHHALGNTAGAERCYRAALDAAPEFWRAWSSLGALLRELGRLEEAEQAYRRALAIDSDHAESHGNLGVALYELRRHDEGEFHLRRAVALRPGFGDALCNLGHVLQALGRFPESEHFFRQALAIAPDSVPAHNGLGVVLQRLGRHEEAEGYARQTAALAPRMADAHANLGNVLLALRRLPEAEQSLRRALAVGPDSAAAHCSLGALFLETRRYQEAENQLRRALALQPDLAEAHNNLGGVLMSTGRLGQAEHSLREALFHRPDFVDAACNLADTLRLSGRIDEAEALFRAALARQPNNALLHSNLLSAINYRAGITLAELSEAHREFARRHEAPLRVQWTPHANVPDPDRPLRIAFVTPDLGVHPIGFLMTDVLATIDRAQFEVCVFSTRTTHDAMTEQLKRRVERWFDAYRASDEALAAQIREERVDLLFDLSGHTGYNRLLVFARRPAPIQITWMGYAGTTGLSGMDYLLTDADLVPSEFDRFYSETIVRLPGAPACYRLPEGLADVGPLPALRNGYVTFGSFNNPAKITPHVVALWSRILKRLQDARLVMKYLGFDDSACKDHYGKLFSEAGIDLSRVTFLGVSPIGDMFARYNEIDIGLDPFPYTGGTTTFLALAMGVPVVTLVGETMANRQSFANLRRIGLEETIARSSEEYVDRSLALAENLSRLAALRAELRSRLLRSPVFDAPRFVRELEATLRELWRRWCANPNADPRFGARVPPPGDNTPRAP